MKKAFTFLLALAMISCFTACSIHVSTGDGGSNDLPNPMTEVESLEALSEKAKCALIHPANVELSDEHYFMIDGDPQIAEYQFTVDKKNCTLRFAPAGMDTDISGIYGEEGTLFEDSDAESHYIENDEYKVQRWFTVDGQYVFCVMDGGKWDWAQFDRICSQFANMEPRNWTSDVPFADYLALVGNYADADNNIAAISIRGDHAVIYVYVNQDESTVKSWEMDAVLKDGKLVYEKELISLSAYDMSVGQTDTTPLEDGGAGCIEISGESLVFAGAYSEELQDLVLARFAVPAS